MEFESQFQMESAGRRNWVGVGDREDANCREGRKGKREQASHVAVQSGPLSRPGPVSYNRDIRLDAARALAQR